MRKKSIYLSIVIAVLILIVAIAGYLWLRPTAENSQVDLVFSLKGPINYEKYEKIGLNKKNVDILFGRLRDFDQKIQADPDYDDMLSYAGFLKILGETDESLKALEKAREKFPDFGPAYAEIANLYIYPYARYNEAVALLKIAIAKASYKSDYYRTLADLYIAKFPEKKSEIEPLMLAGAKETSDNASNFYSYLISFFEREGDYQKAIFYTQKCLKLNPKDEIFKNALLELQKQLKK